MKFVIERNWIELLWIGGKATMTYELTRKNLDANIQIRW